MGSADVGDILSSLLIGQLHSNGQETVGTLDLGGASTQITFLPQFEVSGSRWVAVAAHLAGISWHGESAGLLSDSSASTNRLSHRDWQASPCPLTV